MKNKDRYVIDSFDKVQRRGKEDYYVFAVEVNDTKPSPKGKEVPGIVVFYNGSSDVVSKKAFRLARKIAKLLNASRTESH